jgi:hypothetical protein
MELRTHVNLIWSRDIWGLRGVKRTGGWRGMKINTKSVYFFYLSISQNGDEEEGDSFYDKHIKWQFERKNTQQIKSGKQQTEDSGKKWGKKMKVNKKLACLRMQD